MTRRTDGYDGEALDELRALARHARARDHKIEPAGLRAAARVGVDVRIDAQRARSPELAGRAQRLDDGDPVERAGGEVDDQHVGPGGMDVGAAAERRVVAGGAQHAEDVGAEQQVVEDGDDAGHLLRAQPAELAPERLRAAPVLDRLDAAGAHLAQHELAGDARRRRAA